MKTKTVTHVLSFKAAVSVKDNAEAEEMIRKLIDMGFTFETNQAYVSRQVGNYPSTCDIIDTNALANEEILWSFNFVGGGYNSVIAKSYIEALTKAKLTFTNLTIDPKSFKPLRTKASQIAYDKSLPLMD